DQYPQVLIEHNCQKHLSYPSGFPDLQRSVRLNFLTDSITIKDKKEHEHKINHSECSETEWSTPE
ncbi:hypothetical protein BgiMline_006366, partial [Biomphalaria glabrata]